MLTKTIFEKKETCCIPNNCLECIVVVRTIVGSCKRVSGQGLVLQSISNHNVVYPCQNIFYY